MSKIYSVSQGVSTIGNVINKDQVISELNNSNIDFLKTLNNGVWKSWTKGADAAFQGFDNINKGRGYVIKAGAATSFEIVGDTINANQIPVSTGMCMLAFPYSARPIGDGYIPRMKMGIIKTINSGAWGSWVTGTPDGMQGFTALDDSKGYVCNVESLHGSLIAATAVDNNEGVRFNISNTSVSNGETAQGVSYTDPYGIGTLSFDSVTYDISNPGLIMFFKVGTTLAKLDFAPELLGVDFYVTVSSVTYRGVFTEENDSASAIEIIEVVDVSALELTYTPKTFTPGVYKEMRITLGSINGVIEYASEYAGEEFKVWKDGKIASGTFQETDVTLTLA